VKWQFLSVEPRCFLLVQPGFSVKSLSFPGKPTFCVTEMPFSLSTTRWPRLLRLGRHVGAQKVRPWRLPSLPCRTVVRPQSLGSGAQQAPKAPRETSNLGGGFYHETLGRVLHPSDVNWCISCIKYNFCINISTMFYHKLLLTMEKPFEITETNDVFIMTPGDSFSISVGWEWISDKLVGWSVDGRWWLDWSYPMVN